MSQHTQREAAGGPYSLTTSASTTPEINIEHYASGQVFVPTGSTITTLTYHVAPKAGGTYVPAQDSAAAAVTQTVGAAKAYPIPAAVMGAASIRIVANAAGSVDIVLKT